MPDLTYRCSPRLTPQCGGAPSGACRTREGEMLSGPQLAQWVVQTSHLRCSADATHRTTQSSNYHQVVGMHARASGGKQ